MKLSTLLESVHQNAASVDGAKWYPVRPMTAENTFLKYRIKAAWRVLVGASDAIEWDCQPDKDSETSVQRGQLSSSISASEAWP